MSRKIRTLGAALDQRLNRTDTKELITLLLEAVDEHYRPKIEELQTVIDAHELEIKEEIKALISGPAIQQYATDTTEIGYSLVRKGGYVSVRREFPSTILPKEIVDHIKVVKKLQKQIFRLKDKRRLALSRIHNRIYTVREERITAFLKDKDVRKMLNRVVTSVFNSK